MTYKVMLFHERNGVLSVFTKLFYHAFNAFFGIYETPM